jgi:hypothetical protein
MTELQTSEVSMFCPNCGNQPASVRVKFCPSCGFRLDGVADLLARGGVPSNPVNIFPTGAPQRSALSERKIGIRRGAKMVFSGLAMFLPTFAFCFLVDSPGPLFLPATVFLAGIFWMLYYRLFGVEFAVSPEVAQTAQFGPPPQHAYFPTQQSTPVYSAPVEAPQEQSVVEHTTRTLGRQ